MKIHGVMALFAALTLGGQDNNPVPALKAHSLTYDQHEIRLTEDTGPLQDWEPSRDMVDNLGWGCNGATGEIKDDSCLKGIQARMKMTNSFSSLVYDEVRTKAELMELTKRDFMAKVSAGFFKWGISASASGSFMNQTKITSENITIVGKLDYWHGTALIANRQDIKVGDDIKNLYKNNYAKFHQVYGDGYVSKVDLGESIYFICQSTVDSSCQYSREEIRLAMKARFFTIVNMSGGVNQINELEKKLSASSFNCRVFATGTAFAAQSVSNYEEFKVLQEKFQKYIKERENGGRYSVLRSYISPYAYLMENNEDPAVAENIDKLMKWYELREKFQAVKEVHEFSNHDLVKKCDVVLATIEEEAKKCRMKHPDAKAPKGDEHWDLQLEWMKIYSDPLVEYRAGSFY